MWLYIYKSFLDFPEPYQLGFQAPASPIMEGIVNLHHHIMFFLCWILGFTFAIFFFTLNTFTISKENIAKYKSIKWLYNVNITHHAVLETIWTIIPTLILLLIALPSFALLYAMDAIVDYDMTLMVTGHQWYWSYEYTYPIGFTVLDYSEIVFSFDSYMIPTEELQAGQIRLLEVTAPVVLPFREVIRVEVGASDVLHSWAVPSLGVKIDAMPGRTNQTMMFITRKGKYYGQCSELCGVNHGFMPITVYAVDRNEYKVWVHLVSDAPHVSSEAMFYVVVGRVLPYNVLRESLTDDFLNWCRRRFHNQKLYHIDDLFTDVLINKIIK